MKNTFLKSLLGTILTAIVWIGAAHVHGFGQNSAKSDPLDAATWGHGRSLVGVWIAQVTRRNCETGDPIGPAFQIQNTFAEGGTMLETVQPSAFRSLGNGIWERENGWDRYSFINRFMRYDAAGAFIGSGIVRVNLRLDSSGNSFVTTATNDFIDVNGTVTGSGCATSVGTRLGGL